MIDSIIIFLQIKTIYMKYYHKEFYVNLINTRREIHWNEIILYFKLLAYQTNWTSNLGLAAAFLIVKLSCFSSKCLSSYRLSWDEDCSL